MVEPVTARVPVTEVVAKVDIPLTVRAEVEALTKEVWPDTQRLLDRVKAVAEAVARLVWPDTQRLLERVKAVPEAVVRLVWPLAQRIPETDREVEEATPRIGVTKVGEVCKTFKPVPVLAVT